MVQARSIPDPDAAIVGASQDFAVTTAAELAMEVEDADRSSKRTGGDRRVRSEVGGVTNTFANALPLPSETDPGFETFLSRLRRLVPMIPAGARPDDELCLGTDPLQRAVTLHGIRVLLGNPPPEVLSDIRSLRDAYLVFLAGVGLDPDPLQRRASRDELTGIGVRLRPVEESDLPLLYEAAIDPRDGYRWRFRGSYVTPEQFHAALFDDLLTQFIVEDYTTGEPHGLVVAYAHQPADGHCYVALQRANQTEQRSGQMFEGIILFIDILFDRWPLRKIYGDVPDYNMPFFASAAGNAFEIEGSLRSHTFAKGAWHDLHTLAIYREQWEQLSSEWWTEIRHLQPQS